MSELAEQFEALFKVYKCLERPTKGLQILPNCEIKKCRRKKNKLK